MKLTHKLIKNNYIISFIFIQSRQIIIPPIKNYYNKHVYIFLFVQLVLQCCVIRSKKVVKNFFGL